jgi:hypothetical protein
MEIAWRRLLEVMETVVGWLTQDNMSHPAHNPSLDVTETTDNILNIPCLCGGLLSWHDHSSTRDSGQWFYDTSPVMFPDHLSTNAPRLSQISRFRKFADVAAIVRVNLKVKIYIFSYMQIRISEPIRSSAHRYIHTTAHAQ